MRFAASSCTADSCTTTKGNQPAGHAGLGPALTTKNRDDARFALEVGWGEAAPPYGTPLRLAAARATAQLASDLPVPCILVLSLAGTTASLVAAMRPTAPILAVTSNETTWRQMSLPWGSSPSRARMPRACST